MPPSSPQKGYSENPQLSPPSGASAPCLTLSMGKTIEAVGEFTSLVYRAEDADGYFDDTPAILAAPGTAAATAGFATPSPGAVDYSDFTSVLLRSDANLQSVSSAKPTEVRNRRHYDFFL